MKKAQIGQPPAHRERESKSQGCLPCDLDKASKKNGNGTHGFAPSQDSTSFILGSLSWRKANNGALRECHVCLFVCLLSSIAFAKQLTQQTATCIGMLNGICMTNRTITSLWHVCQWCYDAFVQYWKFFKYRWPTSAYVVITCRYRYFLLDTQHALTIASPTNSLNTTFLLPIASSFNQSDWMEGKSQ